jgi:hypothetical protein
MRRRRPSAFWLLILVIVASFGVLIVTILAYRKAPAGTQKVLAVEVTRLEA